MRLVRCTMRELLAHVDARGRPVFGVEYAQLVGEVVRERVWAAVDGDDVPLAIGGVYRPTDGEPGIAWLSVVPRLSPVIVPAALLMRRIVRSERARAAVSCLVADHNVPGRRLASALGFVAQGDLWGSERRWQ